MGSKFKVTGNIFGQRTFPAKHIWFLYSC